MDYGGIINGSERTPEESTDRYTKFITRRDRALAIIVLSIDPLLLYLIDDPTNPVAVWGLLAGQFQWKTWANKLALQRKLRSLRLKAGQSVQGYHRDLQWVVGNGRRYKRRGQSSVFLPEMDEVLVTALEANTKHGNFHTASIVQKTEDEGS